MRGSERPDVSEEHITSVFMAEDWETSRSRRQAYPRRWCGMFFRNTRRYNHREPWEKPFKGVLLYFSLLTCVLLLVHSAPISDLKERPFKGRIFFRGLLAYPESGSSRFLRNVGNEHVPQDSNSHSQSCRNVTSRLLMEVRVVSDLWSAVNGYSIEIRSDKARCRRTQPMSALCNGIVLLCPTGPAILLTLNPLAWKLYPDVQCYQHSLLWCSKIHYHHHNFPPPQIQEFCPFHVVQTSSGAHPAPYPMGTGGKSTGEWSWPFISN
jgi:hypothetical protein